MPSHKPEPANSQPLGQPTDNKIRMVVDSTRCTFCGMCAKRCTKGAIIVRREKRLHQFNSILCDGCRDCMRVCPKRGLQVIV
jgi:MinD superfamily P-loop ATPase